MEDLMPDIGKATARNGGFGRLAFGFAVFATTLWAPLPNAIVFGRGHVTVLRMVRAGLWPNRIAIAALTAIAYWLVLVGFHTAL